MLIDLNKKVMAFERPCTQGTILVGFSVLVLSSFGPWSWLQAAHFKVHSRKPLASVECGGGLNSWPHIAQSCQYLLKGAHFCEPSFMSDYIEMPIVFAFHVIYCNRLLLSEGTPLNIVRSQIKFDKNLKKIKTESLKYRQNWKAISYPWEESNCEHWICSLYARPSFSLTGSREFFTPRWSRFSSWYDYKIHDRELDFFLYFAPGFGGKTFNVR